MSSDYVKKSTDLSTLLPVRNRDKTLTNVIQNLFNRFLTKNESATIFGYVGSRDPILDVNSVYIPEINLERSVNTLIPTIYTKKATTEYILTWNDIVQKLGLLGVNTFDVQNWGEVTPFNWVPPIDLDKFCNFKEYFWLGPWIQAALKDIANDWGVISPTTSGLENNIISFEIIDDAYIDNSVDELWTVSILNSNQVTVVGSNFGFDSQTTLNPNHNTILSGLRAKIILKLGTYVPGDTITIRNNRHTNLYVTAFNDLLGIDNILKVQSLFDLSNPNYLAEYYVIKKPNGNYDSWTDWSKCNLWVHSEDVITFLQTNFNIKLNIDDISTSMRPIIEYNSNIQLNEKIYAGGPTDISDPIGSTYLQIKKFRNQVPLFDLFYSNGKHSRRISPTFFYSEGNNFEIDPELNRRLATDQNSDFIFEQGLLDPVTNELLFYKDTTDNSLKTIWIPGDNISPEYLKTDITGSIINTDKFNNYSNYYWVGHLLDPSVFPLYYADQAGQPEYTCIQKTGDISDNDWQSSNYWMHITQLDRNNLGQYIPAVQPIIEFNARLNPGLIGTKTYFNQKPQYELYEFNDSTKDYDLLGVSTSSPFKDDIIASNYVLIKNSELLPTQTIGNVGTFVVFSDSMFQFEDTQYVQSLNNFFFETQDYNGTPYNYYGSNSGTLSDIKILSAQGLQTWTLIYSIDATAANSHPTFEVHGSLTGWDDNINDFFPYAIADGTSVYNNGMISFKINTASYAQTDSFVFQFNSSPNFGIKNYVKLKVNLDLDDSVSSNYVYKTVTNAIDIINPETVLNLVQADVTLQDGVFKTPQPFEFNLNNENRQKVGQGDLVFHFASIIEAQSDLIGQSLAANNFRNISDPNLGNGGTIKQFNSGYNLFVGMMNQQNVTPLSLIEFAKVQYSNLQNQATDYALNGVLDRIADGSLVTTAPTYADDLFKFFKSDYILRQNQVVLDSSTPVDDTLAQLFYDSNSPIPNTVITLPQLGLSARVEPTIQLDDELGIMMLTHHDGHKTKLYSYTIDQIKKYVNKTYVRSNKQSTPGTISAKVPPTRPFRNQFWFDTATNNLYYYNVISDIGEEPSVALTNSFSYDRASNALTQFDGTDWNAYGGLNAPWTIIPNIVNDLVLRIEQELFNRIPPTSTRIAIVGESDITLESDSTYKSLLELQFNDFGAKYNITNIYDTSYNPSNAFTWNYSSAFAHATWQDIYSSLYGTSRPDLYPWILTGQTQSAFYTYLSTNSITPNTSSMWTYVKSVFTSHPISVDVNTNTLLPPYHPTNINALTNTIPTGISNSYVFGDHGLIERVWRKSIEFQYDKLKVFFKLDPINFVNDTWGYVNIVNDQLEFNRNKSKKLAQTEFVLHNESKGITNQFGDINITLANSYSADVYIVDIVNRLDSYFRVTRQSDGKEFFHLFNSSFSDSNITSLLVTDDNYYRGLSQGDKWMVTLVVNSDPIVTFIPNAFYSFTGFNQIYIQQLRQLATNLDTTLNVSLLRNYDVKLGYRLSGFIDNSLTTITADTFNLDDNDWSTIIKKNKYLQEFWVHGLRVQIVQKGSTSIRNGKEIPATIGNDPGYLAGKDWVFRIETFNGNKSQLDFYEYNLSGSYDSFQALASTKSPNSLETWLRYKDVVDTRTEYAPFLIQGIQNLLTFLFGYSQKLKDDGWLFYDPFDPVVDPASGRIIDWQLDIEYMINYLFNGGLKAGLGYILNPFKNSAWLNTPRGQVSDITEKNLYDFETNQSIINSSGDEIKPTNFRVFRNNDVTEIISDEPMYGMHVFVDEYEHIILFNDYASNINLVYDPFLGQKIYRFHIIGQKQVNFLGRPSFGGRYLIDGQMKQNLESSIEGVLNYYDVNKMLPNTAETDHARALLGYTEKSYFSNIGLTDNSAFRFWQGMIPNKGSNLSLNAFSNQLNYQNVSLDEGWAIQVAQYGDAGQIANPEIKIYSDDIADEYAHYKFLEDGDSDNDFGYDIFPYEHDYFDSGNPLYEQDDVFAYVEITPEDENYWYSIDDLNTFSSFKAELLNEIYITPTSLDAIYVIADNQGKLVHADCFEIVDTSPLDETLVLTVAQQQPTYRESGEYNPTISDFNPPLFERINSSTIKILDASLLNKVLLVKCYGRPSKAYGPMKIIDYQNNIVTRNDLVLWDPLRGIHNYRAIENIDIQSPVDTARYNNSIFTADNLQYEPLRPWQAEMVGKVWWNTKFVDWKPYHDSKIYRSILDRIYSWGSLADYSNIKIYQWIESPVPPSQYETYVTTQSQLPTSDFSSFRPTGSPLKKLYQRTRKWQNRTVAWKFSDNVCNTPRAFITGTDQRIILSSTKIGLATGYITTGRLDTLGMSKGYKFCNAIWNVTGKLSDPTANVTKVFGESLITDNPTFIVGSGCVMDDGGIFASSTFFDNIKVSVDSSALTNYLTDVSGQIIFNNEYDATTGYYYLIATIVNNNRSQRLQVIDTPVSANTTFNYKFDELGIILSADTIYAHTDNWPTIGASSTDTQRIAAIANDLGNATSDVFIRETFPVNNLIPYDYYYTDPTTGETQFIETPELYSMQDVVQLSWVAWIDPTDLDSDDPVPMNKWEAILGEWLDIGTDLQTVSSNIKDELKNVQSDTRLGLYRKYQYIWNDWAESQSYILPRLRYYLSSGLTREEFFENNFIVPNGTGIDTDLNSITNLPKSFDVYVNKRKIDPIHWTLSSPVDDASTVTIDSTITLRAGDLIEGLVNMYQPTQKELEFNPDSDPVNDDPMKLYQFNYDYPFTQVDKYTVYGYKGTPKYYFWVSDITSITSSKKLSTSTITNLLTNNTDAYSIIQGLKYYNPIDGRPNRYSLLSIKNLGSIVTVSDRYKLRLTTDFSLRDKNTSLDLKNVHTEWTKIREQQSAVIPRSLWDSVINSLCGSNALDEQLPSYKRSLYDSVHNTTYRYGFLQDQVLADIDVMIATVSHTILNTTLNKYINTTDFISDTINFASFGLDSTGNTYTINMLDYYLSTSAEIRKLMENIWTYASSKQINEIFFSVLNDALAANGDMEGIFKTSFVSMQTTRVVSTDQVTGQFTTVTS